MKSKGSGLILIIFIAAALTIIGFSTVRIIFNAASEINHEKEYLSSLYLAEAGVEWGKAKLSNNPQWYTDLKADKDLIHWLRNSAKGETRNISGGKRYKTVKIYKSDGLYGVGYSGKACVIIKYDAGFWEEL